MAIVSRELDRALRRRFALFDRLGALDRRGMHLIDPWPIGASLGMTHDETEQALATPEGVGWIARNTRDVGERVALTVHGPHSQPILLGIPASKVQNHSPSLILMAKSGRG